MESFLSSFKKFSKCLLIILVLESAFKFESFQILKHLARLEAFNFGGDGFGQLLAVLWINLPLNI